MRIVVVVPTYNERKNIEALVHGAFLALKGHPDAHLLIMDDTSPDGTADAVRSLQAQYPRLHLQLGPKQGFGVAYVRGFRYALDALNADVIVQMDADLSHNPADLPRLLACLDGADVVIGSRYVPGGRIPDWPLFRRLTSWGANTLARLVAGLSGVKDCTGGFRALKAGALRKISLAALNTRGYGLQITLLYELTASGATVAEVPITFRDREFGSTKINAREYCESFLNLVRLRLKRSARLVKFGVVGLSGIAVNEGLLAFLVEVAGMHKHYASPFAIEASILTNFLFHSRWTFRNSSNASRREVKFFKFQGISLVSLLINYAVYRLLLATTAMHYLAANLIGIVAAFVWNYGVNVRWTWGEK